MVIRVQATTPPQMAPAGEALASVHQLADFWDVLPTERASLLIQAIQRAHTWHYARNKAYRRTVSARGIGEIIRPDELPRLLRPTAQTFKSYIDMLGTPFAQHQPRAFLDWLADQLSVELPRQRFEQFRPRYPSLEALLVDFEMVFSDFGFEVSTSSGTSGRSTIMLRDQASIEKTVESFYLSFQRYLGMRADHRAIFIMPRETRIAMARMVTFCPKRIGLPDEQVHFTIPFPAHPDQVRIRAGRTFSPGFQGLIERKLWHPFMNWANEHYAIPQAIQRTVDVLQRAEAANEKVLLFGGWVQLHAVGQQLLSKGRILRLEPGSLLGSGGGLKEFYPFTPAQIRLDLARAIVLSDDRPVPICDVYGMAEGNWAAMQCGQGNYHIPPWVYTACLDEDDRFYETPASTGLLAFYDPFGGGELFPSFFKTSDRVKLVNGSRAYDPSLDCPCGEAGAYLAQDSIQRVDLLDEAGCAAQV